MNKKLGVFGFLVVLFVLFVFSLFVGGETKSTSVEKANFSAISDGKSVDVYFFYGEGCSQCARVESFLAEMEQEYPLRFHKFDIYTNRSCLSLFDEYCSVYGLPLKRRGVPTVFVSDTYFVGDSPILGGFEEAVEKALQESTSTGQTLREESLESLDQEVAPVVSSLSMLTVTVAALVDAISPCSIAILVFLIGARVLIANQKKRALKVGLAFCLSVFIAYFLFGLGLFTVVQVSGFSNIFSLLVALIAILAGVFYLKDGFWGDRGGFKMEVPSSLKPLLKKMLKSVTSPIGAFMMGFVVCLFELPCTGGPYLFILGQLANTATRLQAVPLLLYYNFIFVLPLIIISVLLYSNLFSIDKVRKWSDKNKGLLRLVGGFAMVGLGFMVIPVSLILQPILIFLSIFRTVAPPVLTMMFVYLVVIRAKQKNLGGLMKSYGYTLLLLAPLITTAFLTSTPIFPSTKQPYFTQGKIEARDADRLAGALDSMINDGLGSGKLVFLFFYMDTCGWCKKQKPVIDDLESKYSGYVVFLRINGKENVEAKTRFVVQGYPNMFLIHDKDETGYSHEHFIGFTQMDTLEKTLTKTLDIVPVSTYLSDEQSSGVLDTETCNSTEEDQDQTARATVLARIWPGDGGGCTDYDGKHNYDEDSWCYDWRGFHQDYCSGSKVYDWYCYRNKYCRKTSESCSYGCDSQIDLCAKAIVTTTTVPSGGGAQSGSGLVITVLNSSCSPVQNAYVYVYDDMEETNLVCAKPTDENGQCTCPPSSLPYCPHTYWVKICWDDDCVNKLKFNGPADVDGTCTGNLTVRDTEKCSAGYCVDGYCCDSACDGLCEACNVTGSEGTCTFDDTECAHNVYVTTHPNNQEGVLHMVNVTVFNGTSVISSGVSNKSGIATLTNILKDNLTFVAYAKSDYSQVIGIVTVFISSEGQSFDLTCDQNYAEATNSWERITFALSLAMTIITLPLSKLGSRIRIRKYDKRAKTSDLSKEAGKFQFLRRKMKGEVKR